MDGIPLDGAALLKSAMMRGIPATSSSPGNQREQDNQDSDYDDDIDGVPCMFFFHLFSNTLYYN